MCQSMPCRIALKTAIFFFGRRDADFVSLLRHALSAKGRNEFAAWGKTGARFGKLGPVKGKRLRSHSSKNVGC